MERSLEVYKVEQGEVVFDLDRGEETIWATVDQIAQLFGVTRRNVVTHLANIYNDEELDAKRTWKENFQVRIEGNRRVRRKINLYNLDAIISVGYRVNSKKATQFRVWATRVLKKYVVNGVAVNERRLKELPEERLKELEGTLGLVRRLIEKTELGEGEAQGILEVIAKYGKTVETLREFEGGRMPAFLNGGEKGRRGISIGEVRNLAENLGFGEMTEAKERKLEEFLAELMTERGGATLEEKAARLLYYVVNTMPFEEGNKEIGALAFIYFLTVNDFRLAEGGETKISDRALAAIVLLISESKPSEEELIVGVIRKLLE